MHVYCDLFDVLDFAERNEDFLQVKLLPLLFVKGKWHINFLIFWLCMLVVLFLYACLGPTSYAMQLNLFSIVHPY